MYDFLLKHTHKVCNFLPKHTHFFLVLACLHQPQKVDSNNKF